MAIKGKGKTKSRGVARAPRREPVPVPVPLVQRRWVQVTAAFVVGLAVFLFAVWVTNGLRAGREEDRAAEQQQQQREALQSWQAELESQIAEVGQVRQGSPPDVAPQIRSALEALRAGEEPADDAEALTTIAGTLRTVAKDLEDFDLAEQIRDTGIDERAQWVTTSRHEYVEAMRAYRTAALLVVTAMGVEDEDLRAELTERAADVVATADALLASADQGFRLALSSVGIATVAPPETGSSIPGLP